MLSIWIRQKWSHLVKCLIGIIMIMLSKLSVAPNCLKKTEIFHLMSNYLITPMLSFVLEHHLKSYCTFVTFYLVFKLLSAKCFQYGSGKNFSHLVKY